MYVVTYSLKENQNNSDKFYQDISVFTDEVLEQAKELTANLIKNYMNYIETSGLEEIRTGEEYILELLMLGIFWQVYSGDAAGLKPGPQKMLTGLAALRRQGAVLKPGIDFLRGIFSTIFLSPDLYDHLFILEPSKENIDKLLNWMEASGEFNQESKRLRNWQEYLEKQTAVILSNSIASAITLAIWFEERSCEFLGQYTENVERFLNEIRPDHYWREDVIFSGRRRVEYHLNMVGAEIMNRAYRDDFLKTSSKIVVLPACMRLLPGDKCKCKQTDKGFSCAFCSKGCAVNQLTMLGKKNGFDVALIPHESTFSSTVNSEDNIFGNQTGVIGVACVLNLLSGGLMLKESSIAAQCVLLDYCGCKNHWHKEGMPTTISIQQLKNILGLSS